VRLRLTNDHHVVTWHHSHDDGRTWTRLDTRMEVSGLHHNVFGGFLSLRIALYSAGPGAVAFSDFRYRALG
jgi:xylan 1,4-beta-xylosidase